jgi:hypothetical protein
VERGAPPDIVLPQGNPRILIAKATILDMKDDVRLYGPRIEVLLQFYLVEG